MDLNQAVERHTEWKTKFRLAISKKEAMDAEIIARDDCCDLGKWLHGESKPALGNLASHAECVKKHALFHIEAGKVARAINAKKYIEAEAMLNPNTSYWNASTAVVAAILHLKKEAGR